MPDRALIILVVALIAGAAALLRPSIHGTDGVCNYVFARSMIFDGDLDFANEYAAFQELKNYPYPFSQGIIIEATGRPDNSYGPGAAILWSPFVLATRGILGFSGHSDLNDGYSRPFERAVGRGTAFWASLGLVLLYLTLRGLGMGEWLVLGGVAAAWLFTPLLFYMYFHPSMSHGVSFFAAALAMFLLGQLNSSKCECKSWLWLGFGAALGLMILIRMQDIPLVICLAAAAVIWNYRRSGGDEPQVSMPAGRKLHWGPVWAILGLVIMVLPQLAVWDALYGSFLKGPQNYLGQERYLVPRYFFHALFSPYHGLFYWHPVLLAALVGLCLWRPDGGTRLLRFQILGLAALMAQTFLIGSWWSWYGGASFGHRMFVSMMGFFGIGFAVALKSKAEWVAYQSKGVQKGFWIGAAIVFCGVLYWNLGLAWLYGKGIVPHEEPVSWGQIIRGLVIDLPQSLF